MEKEFLGFVMDFFIRTYYFNILFMSWGLYGFVDTIVNPLEDGVGHSLGGNYRGIIGGIIIAFFGVSSMVIKLYCDLLDKEYPWWAIIKQIRPEWEKYTALTVFVLALGRLVYLFFFENFKEKERFRFWIVVLCCALLMLFSGWELIKIFDVF